MLFSIAPVYGSMQVDFQPRKIYTSMGIGEGMAVDKEDQQRTLQKVHDIFSAYGTVDAVRNELKSEGFVVKAEHGEVVSMENADAEIFVLIRMGEDGQVVGDHVTTFDEIELKPARKA